jgi:hypothetical protein
MTEWESWVVNTSYGNKDLLFETGMLMILLLGGGLASFWLWRFLLPPLAEVVSSAPSLLSARLYQSWLAPTDPLVVQLADRFNIDPDNIDSVLALRDWVMENIKYDPSSAHLDTRRALAARRGVCIQRALIIVSALRSKGLKARVAMGKAPERVSLPGENAIPEGALSEHAWPEVFFDGQWINLDRAERLIPPASHWFFWTSAGYIYEAVFDESQLEFYMPPREAPPKIHWIPWPEGMNGLPWNPGPENLES